MCDGPLPPSVEVRLPEDVEALIAVLIAAHVALDEGAVWTTVIHGALWEMRTRAMGRAAARQELEDELLEALRAAPPRRQRLSGRCSWDWEPEDPEAEVER